MNWEEMWSEKISIDVATDGKEISFSSDEIIENLKELSVKTKFGTFVFNAKTFFQGNLSLVETLIEFATRDARGEIAFDLFCGVGIFALALAHNFEKVFAIEQNEYAIEVAKQNALGNKISNAEFLTGDVGNWLFANAEKPDFILLDPPRAGVSRKILNSLVKLKPHAISYVSCDPATLARDLRVLVDGGFAIESITALDMFPQTHHVETVARLKLQE
jgi:23S rRNA (uracil1939-C5)-methyltransferase